MSKVKNQVRNPRSEIRDPKSGHGFTLIELLVAITIVAIVSAIAVTAYSTAQKAARDSKRKQDLQSIATALQLYYQNFKTYPPTGVTASYSTDAGWPNLLSGQYINQMPTDPVNNAAAAPNVSNNNYSYYYWAGDTSGDVGPPFACPGEAGQFYILSARLENKGDPDRNEARNYKWCDGNGLYTVKAYAKDVFIITSQ